MKWALVVLAMLPGLLPAAAAHAGPATTAPQLTLTIHVTITDSRISLSTYHAPRGVEARFVIRNTGTRAHNFTLKATKAAGGVQKGISRTVQPRRQTVVRLFLDFRSRLPYIDVLPADRAKPGMKGFFVIT
jgi:hypothetical protein